MTRRSVGELSKGTCLAPHAANTEAVVCKVNDSTQIAHGYPTEATREVARHQRYVELASIAIYSNRICIGILRRNDIAVCELDSLIYDIFP